MTEVNRRNFTSRSDSENLMDSEKLKMVMDIVGITHVSQDQALFALHDSDFNLVLALENVMKGKPDDQVMQKTSRRKKKESEDTSAGDKSSDANNKDHKGAGEGTDSSSSNKHHKSGGGGGGNRKHNNASSNQSKSKDKEQDQQVKPLMEIQTGNWGDTENRLVNGTLGASHGNRSGDGRRGTGRGRGRGGLSRGSFSGSDRASTRRSAPAVEDSQHHPMSTRNGPVAITDEDVEASQQPFPQPFIVGTFDAKTMENADGEQAIPTSNEGARHYGGGGSENRFGGSSRGRGRFSARGGGSNRNSNPRDRNRTGEPNNSNSPDAMAGAPVPLFDNLWSAEEKWDVKSDGDWRGREFTPTVSNDVIKTAEEDMTSSSAAAYFCNAQAGVVPSVQSDGSVGTNMVTQQQQHMMTPSVAGPVVPKGEALANGEMDCAALQPTTKVNEQYSSSMFDPRVNAGKPEESDNFLLKLLGQQVAMDNQVNNMHHLSSKPVEAEQASQQNRTGSVNSNNHVRNQFMNMSVNPAAAVNNSMNGRSVMVSTAAPIPVSSVQDTPDVPPGFSETLNSGDNLEFGSPPSTFQAGASRKQPPTHIPAAPVELPSPVASFAIGTPVNFGEIDPRYLNRHQYNSMNTAKPSVQNSSNTSVEFFTRKFVANPAVSFVNTPESPSRTPSAGGKQTQTEAVPSVPPGVQSSGVQVSLEQACPESISSRPSPGKSVQVPSCSSSIGPESSRLGGYSAVTSNGGSGLSESTLQPPNVPAPTAATTSNVNPSTSNNNNSAQDMSKFNQRTMSTQQLHSQQAQQQQHQQQSFLYQLPTSSSTGAATSGKSSHMLNNVDLPSKEVSPVASKSQASCVYYSGNSAAASSGGGSGNSFSKMNSRSSPADQQQRMSTSNSMSGFNRPQNSLSKQSQQPANDSPPSASKLVSGSSNNSINNNVASFINAAASQQQQLANAMSAMGIASPTNYQMGYMAVDGNERTNNQIQQLMNSTNSSRYQMQQHSSQQQSQQHQLNSSGSNLPQQYQMVTAGGNPVAAAVMQNGPSNYGAHFTQSPATNQAVHPGSLAAANMVALSNQQQSPSNQMKNSNDGGSVSAAGGPNPGAPMGHYSMNLSSGAASLQQSNNSTTAEMSKMMSNNPVVSSNVRRLASEDNSSSMGTATSANSSHVASTSVQHAQQQQQQNLAQNPAATPLPFFLATAAHPYHAAATSFPPSNPAAAATAFYPQAAVSAFLNNPAAQAMFQTFNLPQLQAQLQQQQQSPGASVQPVSSATQQTLKSQQLSMGAHNGPSNTSQQAFANSGQMGNSYFQGAQNSDYMSGGASSVSANDYKYGAAASQQQQMGAQSAAIGAYGSRSSSGATGAGMAATNVSNKNNLYGNSSDYSALYAKGLDKSGGNVGGLSAPGLASTSPPQGANANFSNYMPAAFGPQAAAAAAAAGSPQLYSQQQFLSAAAAQSLITHDPRASAVGGSLKQVSGLGPASSTLHSKHATGQHSGPVSSFASNNFSWQ